VLASDLGGGKTTLAKGLAAGLGCVENVSSPTFTVSREYKCARGLMLHHFDFYRLNEPGVVTYELSEVIDDLSAVTVIEWADIVEDYLPAKRILIRLDRTADAEDHRQITVDCSNDNAYIAEALV
jgi:tRNA threonylcarbamoyladenosine biosynthesis protein TsaE